MTSLQRSVTRASSTVECWPEERTFITHINTGILQQHDHRLRAVAVDSERILEQAEKARAKAKAAGEAAEAAAKLAAEREDERIARLKAVRGEEWLPSLRTQGFPDEKSGQAIGRAGRPKM